MNPHAPGLKSGVATRGILMSMTQRLNNRLKQTRDRVGIRPPSDVRWFDEAKELLRRWDNAARNSDNPGDSVYEALDVAAHLLAWAEDAWDHG
jgi:hypothetical protein